MVQGLKFLSKKGFNPANRSNQKRVWEAEQEKKLESVRIKERETQLQREREDEELARARGLEPRLNFMYAPPPALHTPGNDDVKSKPGTGGETGSAKANDLSLRQAGDDDAAAAFRLLLAQGVTSSADNDGGKASHHQQQHAQSSAFGSTVLKGSSAPNESKKLQLSALEKAVGRKKDTSALTLDEQIQRFPALANAPRAKGMTATDVGASFKPLGTQIRNVKCLACGIWGHSRGDRECELSGWDPFASRPKPAPRGSTDNLPPTTDSKTDEGKRDDYSSSSDASGRRYKKKRRKKRKRYEHYYSDNSVSSRERDSRRRYDSESAREREQRREHKKHKKSQRYRQERSPSAGRRHKSSKRSNDEEAGGSRNRRSYRDH